MIEETGTQSAAEETTGPAAAPDTTVVAFCQQCGRPLTAATRRQVGSAVFCEPCATLHEAQTTGWTPVNAAAGTQGPTVVGGAPAVAEPNPMLAGFLGLIPGVGAMYNGQYAKGVIHLIVFVVLVSLADNLNWVFWWFVWGWVFYQAFEAYHTAQARRDGQPLPDPFGWNGLGERFGMSRSWPPPVGTARPNAQAPFSTAPPPTSPQTPPVGAAPPAGSGAGFNSPPAPYPGSTGYGQPYYAPTFTGPVQPPVNETLLAMNARRFPAGAVWLIGFGVLFLLGNVVPMWRIDARWLVPILLGAVAFWTGGRRIATLSAASGAIPGNGLQREVAEVLLGPGILLTVAVLLALQDASWISLRHSWPALLIVWGVLLLLQRTVPPSAASPSNPVSPQAAGPRAPGT